MIINKVKQFKEKRKKKKEKEKKYIYISKNEFKNIKFLSFFYLILLLLNNKNF